MTAHEARNRPAYAWLALAALAMAVLEWFNGRPEAAGLIAEPWDKLVHLLIFGGLGLLLVLGDCAPRLGFFILMAFGAFDELRQLDLPGRSASWGDFGVDVFAAAIVFPFAGWLRRRNSAYTPSSVEPKNLS
jgi:VanZ family protein